MAPFATEKQKGWLWKNKPDIAKKWTKKYGSEVVTKLVKEKRKKKAKI